jgi:DNA-binding IclR family transcriptional regulator
VASNIFRLTEIYSVPIGPSFARSHRACTARTMSSRWPNSSSRRPESARGSDTRSLDRAFLLARLLSANTRFGWRITDLAEASGLEVSTTHRLLKAMLRSRMAYQIPDSRRYTLGPLAFELGLATAHHHDLRRLSEEMLQRACRELGATLFVMSRSGFESVCLSRQDASAAPSALMLDVGGRRPLIQTAGGLAIFFALPFADQQAIETANRHALQSREHGLLDGIDRMRARSRRVGCALNLGDVVPGINATACAVSGPEGSVLGSVVCAQAAPPWEGGRIKRIRAVLDRVSADLGQAWAQLRY